MTAKIKSWGNAFEELFLKENPVSATDERQVLSLDGGSVTYICKLWDGVFLWGNDVHSGRIDYPDHDFDQKNYAVINICHAGRCEVEMQDDTYIYMTPGLLNVNNHEPKGGYIFPGELYEGIEIAFDMEIMKERVPAELSSFGLSLDSLNDFLERGNGNYMARASDAAIQRSKFLYERIRKGDLAISDYRFLTVSLLYHLKNGEATEIKNRSMVTKGQRRIAVEAEQILTDDYRKHYTVEELAGRYGVSPSAFKKYFEAVFGSPVSYYLRDKRMSKAKEILSTTNVSVGETAAACGYENQGKFGSAFKAYTGISPLEYRRLHKAVQEEKQQ